MNDKYAETIEKIEVVVKWLLINLADEVKSDKDIYLRNALAKGLSIVKAIHLLYNSNDYYNGWILYRSLVDRLVYIYHLTDNNYFDAFSEWSYIKAYEHKNNVRADERFKRVLKDPNYSISSEEKIKYTKLKSNEINWNKPDPKGVLKEKGLDFIYKYGYDYASSKTHPLITDGDYEFYHFTGLKPNPYKIMDNTILMSNALLINTLVQQEVLNNLNQRFIGAVYTFFGEVMKKINNEPNKLNRTFQILIQLAKDHSSWFEKQQ